ncbi:MAG: hypothetical protein ACKV2O_21315 [Acidimicrobiales bacterium]
MPASSPSTSRRWAAVLVGTFVGLAALVGFVVSQRPAEDDPGPAASPAASNTTAPGQNRATGDTAADRDTLREFVDFATGTDGTLRRLGNRPERVMPACQTAMTDATTKFGALPATPPQIPTSLVTALASLGHPQDGVLGQLIDTFFRRLQACIDGDQPLYTQLQVEEDGLRDQLPDL